DLRDVGRGTPAVEGYPVTELGVAALQTVVVRGLVAVEVDEPHVLGPVARLTVELHELVRGARSTHRTHRRGLRQHVVRRQTRTGGLDEVGEHDPLLRSRHERLALDAAGPGRAAAGLEDAIAGVLAVGFLGADLAETEGEVVLTPDLRRAAGEARPAVARVGAVRLAGLVEVHSLVRRDDVLGVVVVRLLA